MYEPAFLYFTAVRRARRNALPYLHAIARPYLHYPPLDHSHWTLPKVTRWEPYTTPDGASRALWRLDGKLVTPSVVEFVCPPNHFVTADEMSKFKLHLSQRTGSPWELDWQTQLWRNVVVAQRRSQRLSYTSPSDAATTHTLQLPASAQSPSMGLLAGLFRDGWSREERHSARDRETGLAVPEMRGSVHEPD